MPSRKRKSDWSSIRNEAVFLALLFRRSDGLWSKPTSKAEIGLTFAPEDDVENQIRLHGFGHSSITVSYRALCALEAAYGRLDGKLIATSMRSLVSHRDPKGGYGSSIPQINGYVVNGIPRHTAMAIMLILHFRSCSETYVPDASLHETTFWLLDNTNTTGG